MAHRHNPWIFVLMFYFLHRKSGAQAPMCPPRWLFVNSFCWHYNPTPKTWQDARRECRAFGGDLASITSREENYFLQSMAQLESSRDRVKRNALEIQNKPETRFPVIRNAMLIGSNRVTLQGIVSPESCQHECLSSGINFNFECLSLMFWPGTGTCILNSESRSTQPTFFRSDVSNGQPVNYYEKVTPQTLPVLQPEEPERPLPRLPLVPLTPPKPTIGFAVVAPPSYVSPKPLDPNKIEMECFATFKNHVLVGYADQVKTDYQLEDCYQECEKMKGKESSTECNSFIYYKAQKICIMNRASRRSNPDLFVEDEEADFYERIEECPHSPTPARAPIENRCFRISPNSLLIGFVRSAVSVRDLADCQELCKNSLNTRGFVCKSLMYYPETKDCLLNNASSSLNPGHLTSDTNGEAVDYFENLCAQEVKPFEDRFDFETRVASSSRDIWLGLRRNDLTWLDSKPLIFHNWAPGHPNRNFDHNCVVLDRERQTWEMSDCHQRNSFFCKMDLFELEAKQ